MNHFATFLAYLVKTNNQETECDSTKSFKSLRLQNAHGLSFKILKLQKLPREFCVGVDGDLHIVKCKICNQVERKRQIACFLLGFFL